MSVLDDLKLARESLRGRCLTCQWLETQDPQLKIEIMDWVRDGLSRKALFRTLRPHGLNCGETSLHKHIRQCVLGEEI